MKNNTKKLLPVVIIAIMIGVAAAGFLIMNKGSKETSTAVPESTSESSSEVTSSGDDTFTGSLIDAVKLGVGMKCTYQVEGNEYEGYVKGKNYRGKVKTAEGKIGEVIMKDNCMWTWTADENQGIKTCFDESDTEGETENFWQSQGSVGDMSYKCAPAAITEDKFNPPTNINFMDINSMMENFGAEGVEIPN